MVRHRYGGFGRFNYRCNYMQVFFKYKYNVKTCMCTISAFYHIKNIFTVTLDEFNAFLWNKTINFFPKNS